MITTKQLSGYLQLFNPSSTTFVKHFIGTSDGSSDIMIYNNNILLLVMEILHQQLMLFSFQMSSGNIDSGTIKLYGIKGD
jgi:hypothetical protein